MQHIPDEQRVLVLYGDVPLISRSTLRELLSLADGRRLALLTMKADNTEGYGRIVRNSRGGVQRIVEEKDATQAQRRIRECNTGVLVSPARLLKGWLARLKADNSQREYYLTDVVGMAVKDRVAVSPLVGPSAGEAPGVKDKAPLTAPARLGLPR